MENNRKPQMNNSEPYSLYSILRDVHHVLKELLDDREKRAADSKSACTN